MNPLRTTLSVVCIAATLGGVCLRRNAALRAKRCPEHSVDAAAHA